MDTWATSFWKKFVFHNGPSSVIVLKNTLALLLPPFCWFSLDNSETVKAVTLPFCSIQKHFIRDFCTKFGIPNSPQSPDIGQNLDGGISASGYLVNPL